ncbi:MAG: MurR/RpiR family transcriptional regulator [Clostridia bacterium]|nr:MurR/RpiR family transcriptional regulator [Clostridia bacterium]
MDILSYLKSNMSQFSKRQRMIAQYILESYDRAAYMTAAKLSDEVGVSESTVVRFAAELGFDGYQSFQKILQEVTRTQLTSVQRMEVASRRIGNRDILTDVLNSDIDKIEKTLQEIDGEEFKNAVAALSEAKKIYIIGARSAASLAMFAGFYFNLIFDDVRLIQTTSASDLFEQILRVDKGDVVLGISFPRYSKSTIKALEYAKGRGAIVIGLTDGQNSPIVKESTYCLIAKSDMEAFVDSLVAPFSVLNALIVALGMNRKDKVLGTFEQLEHIWDAYGVYDKRAEE